jgi:hypothetical protein
MAMEEQDVPVLQNHCLRLLIRWDATRSELDRRNLLFLIIFVPEHKSQIREGQALLREMMMCITAL